MPFFQNAQAGDVECNAAPLEERPTGNVSLDPPQGVHIVGRHADTPTSGSG
jgi:hypothetical protein